jgi:hypothetical protein
MRRVSSLSRVTKQEGREAFPQITLRARDTRALGAQAPGFAVCAGSSKRYCASTNCAAYRCGRTMRLIIGYVDTREALSSSDDDSRREQT